MATCRACSSEITGTDRYCRNCGVPVAPTVAEFDDTRRFNPSATLPAAPPGLPDPTNPLYAPPSAAYAAGLPPPTRSAPFAKDWAAGKIPVYTERRLGVDRRGAVRILQPGHRNGRHEPPSPA